MNPIIWASMSKSLLVAFRIHSITRVDNLSSTRKWSLRTTWSSITPTMKWQAARSSSSLTTPTPIMIAPKKCHMVWIKHATKPAKSSRICRTWATNHMLTPTTPNRLIRREAKTSKTILSPFLKTSSMVIKSPTTAGCRAKLSIWHAPRPCRVWAKPATWGTQVICKWATRCSTSLRSTTLSWTQPTSRSLMRKIRCRQWSPLFIPSAPPLSITCPASHRRTIRRRPRSSSIRPVSRIMTSAALSMLPRTPRTASRSCRNSPNLRRGKIRESPRKAIKDQSLRAKRVHSKPKFLRVKTLKN